MTDLEMTRRSTYAERRRDLSQQIAFALQNHYKQSDGCWIWMGPRYRGQYGTFMAKKQHFLAHRASYEHSIGTIPDGLVLDHLCRNPLCINPSHLEPVSNRTNILRGRSPFALNAAKTHCKRGHPLINAWLHRGRRVCRECSRQRLQEWRSR